MEVIGEALLSASLEVLLDRLASRDFLDLFKGNKPIEELLPQFQIKLRPAYVLLLKYEEKQLTNNYVRESLHDLKEVIFRADELRDKIDYEVLRRKCGHASICSTFSFNKSVEEEMKNILGDLDTLLNQGAFLCGNALSPRSNATPFVRDRDIYGRKYDKKAIMKLMLPDKDCGDKKPVLIIPITGMDGIGKTTLAQLVFNDQRVKEYFEIRVWVGIRDCVGVSTKFAALKITKRILELVKSKPFVHTELSMLQGELEEALATKKFLFVLDDVWDENPLFWNELGPLFTFGASGSTIIITTSSRTIAKTAVENKRGEIYHLGVLKDSTCWNSFFRRAIKNKDLDAHPDLRDIGKEIARKCQGLPLAAKHVAAFLGSISLEKWRTILDNKMWDLRLQEITSNYILPALWLSYSNLSPQLKRCFAYCSIFPKDHEFLKENVILLWMAEGLLQSEGEATMEVVGEEYIENLTSRSFFQPGESNLSFTMHGCMHDLATFVLGDHGFRLEENKLRHINIRARYLSIMKKYIRDLRQFEGVFDAKFLRTFLTLKFNGSLEDQHKVPLQKLLIEEGLLRVVSVSHYRTITELPDSVGMLKHLRYLDLSGTDISEIPRTIRSLYNLETLLLKCCTQLTQLPAEIGHLLKLRHIMFDGSHVKEIPLQISNLKYLQTLTGFFVCKEDGGSRIRELGDLQHLHGKFDIWGLENVAYVNNVSAARLRDKKFLMLGLYWNRGSAGSSDPGKHKLVLDELKPHTNLKELRISGYNGTSFSNWMGDQSFGNIVKVELFKCGTCDSLSPIEQLPSLKELWISEWLVETLSLEFNSNGSSMTEPFKHLEALYFLNMPNWKEWSFTDGKIFPCLKQLQFHDCPQLDVWLPDCFPALKKLAVNCCKQLKPLLIPGSTYQGGGRRFSSLKELQIFACPEQRDFLDGELPSRLKIRKFKFKA